MTDERARAYAENIIAHMDNGGKTDNGNVYDLARFILASAPAPAQDIEGLVDALEAIRDDRTMSRPQMVIAAVQALAPFQEKKE